MNTPLFLLFSSIFSMEERRRKRAENILGPRFDTQLSESGLRRIPLNLDAQLLSCHSFCLHNPSVDSASWLVGFG